MLNNREIASVILLGGTVLWMLTQQSIRESLKGVFKAFFQLHIAIPLLAMLAWIGLECWLGSRFALWNMSLVKGSTLWALGSAFVLLYNSIQASPDPHFFLRLLRGTVGISVFVGFFMNLYVMSLPAELALQFVLTVLTLTARVGGYSPEHKKVKVLCEGLLVLIVIALFVYTVQQVYLCWNQLNVCALLLDFVLPIWLTVGLLPFLFFLSVYVVYEMTFRLINSRTLDHRGRWRARMALISTLHFRTGVVHKFRGHWVKDLSDAPTFSTACKVVAKFCDKLRFEKQASADEQERILRYTGSQETDAEGRRMDRREFAETIKALRWLETCQMGWYRNRGGRYRGELLKLIGKDFTRQGLPKDSGISLHASSDGQSWYAWRRTVTGWCFAIGANGPPPNQWVYDGPEPPQGFPGQDSEWGDVPFNYQVNRNWC